MGIGRNNGAINVRNGNVITVLFYSDNNVTRISVCLLVSGNKCCSCRYFPKSFNLSGIIWI